MGSALLQGCKKEIDTEIVPAENTEVSTDVKTYTMSISAGKGEGGTKALGLEADGKLSATWKTGETVKVFNSTQGNAELGILAAQGDGPSTTLKGTLSDPVSEGDKLVLKYLSPSYSTQDGTLSGNETSIDKVCDYAVAEVTVSSTSGNVISTNESANFENQQAIVKFILRNSNDSEDINARPLKVTVDGEEITVTPASATNEFYVAVPAVESSRSGSLGG